jgi:hypothetical protein
VINVNSMIMNGFDGCDYTKLPTIVGLRSSASACCEKVLRKILLVKVITWSVMSQKTMIFWSIVVL